jgi:hypothetical protein
VDLVQFAAQFRPGAAAGVLRDPGQAQRQSAQDDVGADPLLFPVIDRAQVDDLLHVPPAAFYFRQLLVPDGDVFGGELRVRGPQQVLPVEILLGFRLRGVGAQQPAGRGPQAESAIMPLEVVCPSPAASSSDAR